MVLNKVKKKNFSDKKEVMSVILEKNLLQAQWHYDLLKDDIWKEITQQVSAVTFLQRTVQELKRKTEKHVRANQGNIKTKIGGQKTWCTLPNQKLFFLDEESEITRRTETSS